MNQRTAFPVKGRSREDIFSEMDALQSRDIQWKNGKFFGYVFYPEEDIYQVAKDAYLQFFATNGLNPSAFPSLRKMETDVVRMAAELLGGDENTTGCMTSGGTESILMAVLSAREYAIKNKKYMKQGEVLVPASAHPAFAKACHFFGLKLVEAPLKPDFRVDVSAMEKLISPNTILMVASAPQFPQGVIDPVREVAAMAEKRGILCHVDGCVGGFILPFLKRAGEPIPDFDLSVPGVTSMSADLHKYAYTAKGASVILYKNKDLRKGQFFIKTDWNGGIYGSPSVAGTRPGGAIAAAWAVLNYTGLDRYTQMAARAIESTRKMMEGIRQIQGLNVLSNPEGTLFAIASDELDIHKVADEMHELGWYFNRQQDPPSLHCYVTDIHVGKEQILIDDLSTAVNKAKAFTWTNFKTNVQVKAVRGLRKMLPAAYFDKIIDKAGNSGGSPSSSRKAAMYGMMGELSGSGKLDDIVLDFIDQLNSPEAESKA